MSRIDIIVSFASKKYKFQIEEQVATIIKELIVQFTGDCTKLGANKSQIFSHYHKIFNTKIDRILSHSSFTNHNQRLFSEFVYLIERDLSKTHKVGDYSRRMGITSRKLTSLCRQFREKKAKDLIDERLVSESKRLLQFTSYPIKEISYLLGFSDQYQFSKYFKKHVKVSPVYYRKK